MSKTAKEIIELTENLIHFLETKDNKIYNHLMYMSDQIQFDIPESEKAHRWVGFIHGVLWTKNIVTIDELRELCKSEN